MFKWFGTMLAAFVVAIIPRAAAEMFGDQVVALFPSGVAVEEWTRASLIWMGTPAAAFSYFALGLGLFVWAVVQYEWFSRPTTVFISLFFTAGAVLGVVYRANHQAVIENFWLDPALWILFAGLLATPALWSAWKGLERPLNALGEWVFDRLETRQLSSHPAQGLALEEGCDRFANAARREESFRAPAPGSRREPSDPKHSEPRERQRRESGRF